MLVVCAVVVCLHWLQHVPVGSMHAAGVCQGPATLRMPNGDTEERMYEAGALHGIATFFSQMGDRYSSKANEILQNFLFVVWFLLQHLKVATKK